MPTLETKKHSFENTEETRTDYKKHKCQNSRIFGRAQEIRFTENILALSQNQSKITVCTFLLTLLYKKCLFHTHTQKKV